MANTFDMPVLVHQTGDDKYRLYRGSKSPDGPIHEPADLPSLYQSTGPLDAYFRLVPPTINLSREAVLAWLQGAREMGCEVREVEAELARVIIAKSKAKAAINP